MTDELMPITNNECPCDVRYLDYGFVCHGTARSVSDNGWVLVWRDEDGTLVTEVAGEEWCVWRPYDESAALSEWLALPSGVPEGWWRR